MQLYRSFGICFCPMCKGTCIHVSEPRMDPLGTGYHVVQSMIAIAPEGYTVRDLNRQYIEPAEFCSCQEYRLHFFGYGRSPWFCRRCYYNSFIFASDIEDHISGFKGKRYWAAL